MIWLRTQLVIELLILLGEYRYGDHVSDRAAYGKRLSAILRSRNNSDY